MYVHAIMNGRPVLLVASLTAFAGYCLIFLIQCYNCVCLFLFFIVVFGMLIKQWFYLRDVRDSYERSRIGNYFFTCLSIRVIYCVVLHSV